MHTKGICGQVLFDILYQPSIDPWPTPDQYSINNLAIETLVDTWLTLMNTSVDSWLGVNYFLINAYESVDTQSTIN